MNTISTLLNHLVHRLLFVILFGTCCFGANRDEKTKKPNILLILADDLGWNDVDWHDPTLHSPNINSLAHGPQSRINSGVSSGNGRGISMVGTNGVPLKYPFFPERLQDQGYGTYMIGKWHLGHCKFEFLPTRRGFDKFRGYYAGMEDYFKHGMFNKRDLRYTGLDFWEDTPNLFKADWSSNGLYSTEIFANESVKILQEHDKSKPLFLYLAFQAVHEPMQNGGDTMWGANNYPLRGNKDTLWEGGTRIVSFVHSPNHITVGGTRTKYSYLTFIIHIVDWYATILAMSGINLDGYGDGFNHWPMIANDSSIFERKSFVYNIAGSTGAIREGHYKLIVGDPGRPADWAKPTEFGIIGPPLNQSIWLFDIANDPQEKRDLSTLEPSIVDRLMQQFKAIASTASPNIHMPSDPRGDPSRFNGTFASGWC